MEEYTNNISKFAKITILNVLNNRPNVRPSIFQKKSYNGFERQYGTHMYSENIFECINNLSLLLCGISGNDSLCIKKINTSFRSENVFYTTVHYKLF